MVQIGNVQIFIFINNILNKKTNPFLSASYTLKSFINFLNKKKAP